MKRKVYIIFIYLYIVFDLFRSTDEGSVAAAKDETQPTLDLLDDDDGDDGGDLVEDVGKVVEQATPAIDEKKAGSSKRRPSKRSIDLVASAEKNIEAVSTLANVVSVDKAAAASTAAAAEEAQEEKQEEEQAVAHPLKRRRSLRQRVKKELPSDFVGDY